MNEILKNKISTINDDIDVLFSEDNETEYCFIFKSGQYKDVIYRYINVNIGEVEGEINQYYLDFGYEILKGSNVEVVFDEQFENIIGDFLQDTIEILIENDMKS